MNIGLSLEAHRDPKNKVKKEGRLRVSECADLYNALDALVQREQVRVQ